MYSCEKCLVCNSRPIHSHIHLGLCILQFYSTSIVCFNFCLFVRINVVIMRIIRMGCVTSFHKYSWVAQIGSSVRTAHHNAPTHCRSSIWPHDATTHQAKRAPLCHLPLVHRSVRLFFVYALLLSDCWRVSAASRSLDSVCGYLGCGQWLACTSRVVVTMVSHLSVASVYSCANHLDLYHQLLSCPQSQYTRLVCRS